jgi:hypothetical protein
MRVYMFCVPRLASEDRVLLCVARVCVLCTEVSIGRPCVAVRDVCICCAPRLASEDRVLLGEYT